MKHMRIVLAMVVCLAAVPAMAQDQTLESVEAKVKEAWDKLKSLSADVAIEADIPNPLGGAGRMQLSGTGKVDYLKHDGKYKYREQVSVGPKGSTMALASGDIVHDGAETWVTYKLMTKEDYDKLGSKMFQGTVPPGGGKLIELAKQDLNLTVKPDAEVDGAAVYVLEAQPKQKIDEIPVEKAVINIDKETGLMRKLAFYETDTKEAITITMSNIKKDPELSPALFVFSPPASPEADKKPAASGAEGGAAK